MLYVALDYKKKNPARRAVEKNNLAPILSDKKFSARTKNPSPPLISNEPCLTEIGMYRSVLLFGKMKHKNVHDGRKARCDYDNKHHHNYDCDSNRSTCDLIA